MAMQFARQCASAYARQRKRGITYDLANITTRNRGGGEEALSSNALGKGTRETLTLRRYLVMPHVPPRGKFPLRRNVIFRGNSRSDTVFLNGRSRSSSTSTSWTLEAKARLNRATRRPCPRACLESTTLDLHLAREVLQILTSSHEYLWVN